MNMTGGAVFGRGERGVTRPASSTEWTGESSRLRTGEWGIAETSSVVRVFGLRLLGLIGIFPRYSGPLWITKIFS